MSVVETLKSVIPGVEDDVDTTTYECQECGHTFASAKNTADATCMECLSTDVEPQSE